MKAKSYFIKKEKRLDSAIKKVQDKLKTYSEYGDRIYALCVKQRRNWKPEEHEPVKDWNKLHDLEYRLTNRRKDNYFEYQHEHFIKHGWVAY